MKIQSRPSWFAKLAGQFGMGAMLGVFAAIYLIVTDTQRLFQMMINSSTPEQTMMVFVGVVALSFAVGATLTGWIFHMQDEAEQR